MKDIAVSAKSGEKAVNRVLVSHDYPDDSIILYCPASSVFKTAVLSDGVYSASSSAVSDYNAQNDSLFYDMRDEELYIKKKDAEEAAKSSFFKMRFPLGTEESRIQDEIFDVQQKIITELADKESCIIVGRCSDYVLRNYKNVIHIYIYAPYEARINNCVDYLHMTREDAIKEMTTVDKARCAYHEKYAGYAPDDFNHKNYMVDSSVLGVDGTAEILADIVRKKFCI